MEEIQTKMEQYYERATGVAKKDNSTRVATLLTVIGGEAVEVYNEFTWNEEDDELKIKRVLEKFESFCNPRKNTIYERYVFSSRVSKATDTCMHS